MLRALATLSVLALISFAFSSAVALMIATHASPADAAPIDAVPAIGGQNGATCPALPEGTVPTCPALRGDGSPMTEVIEAARRAGCPAFSEAPRNARPVPAVPPPASIVTASTDLPVDLRATLS